MLTEYMKAHKYSSVLSFMAAIAKGEINVADIKSFILEKNEGHHEEVQPDAVTPEKTLQYSGTGEDILVLNAKNVKGLDYKMAACCNPVFGDDVFGFVTRSAGIKIHRVSCPNAARLLERYPYRIQKVIWQDNASAGTFQATLVVTAENETPVMSAILDVTGQFRVSVRSLTVNENPRNGTQEITIRMLVPSNLELDKVISQVGNLRQVIKVKRL